MNRKYSIFTIFVIMAMTSSLSCSMYETIRTIAVCALPFIGATKSQVIFLKMQEPIEGKPAPEKAKIWAENIMKQCNSPIVPFVSHSDGHWEAVSNSVIRTNPKIMQTLETILEKESNHRSDDDNKKLDLWKMCLMHELFHIKNQDASKGAFATVMIPTAIQMATSGTAYGFNKLFKIQPPKTKVSIFGRSLLLATALALKQRTSTMTQMAFLHYRENNADKFACKMALESGTSNELEQYAQFWKEREKEILTRPEFADIQHDPFQVRSTYFHYVNPLHPYPGDRGATAEKYLLEWKNKHALE